MPQKTQWESRAHGKEGPELSVLKCTGFWQWFVLILNKKKKTYGLSLGLWGATQAWGVRVWVSSTFYLLERSGSLSLARGTPGSPTDTRPWCLIAHQGLCQLLGCHLVNSICHTLQSPPPWLTGSLPLQYVFPLKPWESPPSLCFSQGQPQWFWINFPLPRKQLSWFLYSNHLIQQLLFFFSLFLCISHRSLNQLHETGKMMHKHHLPWWLKQLPSQQGGHTASNDITVRHCAPWAVPETTLHFIPECNLYLF